MIRSLISVAILGGVIYLGATVNLGTRTFFGHVANIWQSDEANELKKDVGPKLDDMSDRAKRGWEQFTKDPKSDGGPSSVRTAGQDVGAAAATPAADAGPSK